MEIADDASDQGRSKPRVFIYGSCASRDAFEFEGAPTLANYRARSSVASAFSAPGDLPGKVSIEANPSPFQQRMVKSDLTKDLSHLLSTTPFDLLLVDFIDERLRIVRSNVGYDTYSPELNRMGFRPVSGTLVDSGSDEHLEAFTAGWSKLLSIVPEEKIIIARAYWARFDDKGQELEDGPEIERNNLALAKLYSHVESVSKVRFIDYSEEDLRADSNHKWGPAPFHYPESFHQKTLAGIQRFWNETRAVG